MGKTNEEIYKEYMAQQQKYQQEADDYLAAYDSRPAFSYDASTDPLYRSVRDQYIHQGQRAMQDTMGQAAGLTGGYASSYGQAVGNQAFNEYMSKLSGVAGEYAQMARSAYDAEGQQMLDRYNLAQNSANLAYSQGRDALADMQYDKEKSYTMAMQMIQTGQTPDAALLTAAGIDAAWAAKMAKYYAAQMAGTGAGGSSSGSGSKGGSGSGSGSGNGDGTTSYGAGDANAFEKARQAVVQAAMQDNYQMAEQALNKYAGDLNEEQAKQIMAMLDNYFAGGKAKKASVEKSFPGIYNAGDIGKYYDKRSAQGKAAYDYATSQEDKKKKKSYSIYAY